MPSGQVPVGVGARQYGCVDEERGREANRVSVGVVTAKIAEWLLRVDSACGVPVED